MVNFKLERIKLLQDINGTTVSHYLFVKSSDKVVFSFHKRNNNLIQKSTNCTASLQRIHTALIASVAVSNCTVPKPLDL